MTNKEAYKIIAKHVFFADYRYNAEFKPVLILADNLEDAQEKALAHFGISVSVWRPEETKTAGIFTV